MRAADHSPGDQPRHPQHAAGRLCEHRLRRPHLGAARRSTVPGWSSSARGGPAAPGGTTQGVPGGLIAGPSLGENTRGGAMMSGAPNYAPGPSSSNMIGGEPARVGGAPPGDTSRSPGSSGISGAGVGNTGGIGGPIR